MGASDIDTDEEEDDEGMERLETSPEKLDILSLLLRKGASVHTQVQPDACSRVMCDDMAWHCLGEDSMHEEVALQCGKLVCRYITIEQQSPSYLAKHTDIRWRVHRTTLHSKKCIYMQLDHMSTYKHNTIYTYTTRTRKDKMPCPWL